MESTRVGGDTVLAAYLLLLHIPHFVRQSCVTFGGAEPVSEEIAAHGDDRIPKAIRGIAGSRHLVAALVEGIGNYVAVLALRAAQIRRGARCTVTLVDTTLCLAAVRRRLRTSPGREDTACPDGSAKAVATDFVGHAAVAIATGFAWLTAFLPVTAGVLRCTAEPRGAVTACHTGSAAEVSAAGVIRRTAIVVAARTITAHSIAAGLPRCAA